MHFKSFWDLCLHLAGRSRGLRFQEPQVVEIEDDFVKMDYTDAGDFWFDWESLEEAEAGSFRGAFHAFHQLWLSFTSFSLGFHFIFTWFSLGFLDSFRIFLLFFWAFFSCSRCFFELSKSSPGEGAIQIGPAQTQPGSRRSKAWMCFGRRIFTST